MKLLLLGASGTLGSALVDALLLHHEVLRASRNCAEFPLDLANPHSIVSLYAEAYLATLLTWRVEHDAQKLHTLSHGRLHSI